MNRSTLFGIVAFLALGMISINLVAQDAISGTVFLVDGSTIEFYGIHSWDINPGSTSQNGVKGLTGNESIDADKCTREFTPFSKMETIYVDRTGRGAAIPVGSNNQVIGGTTFFGSSNNYVLGFNMVQVWRWDGKFLIINADRTGDLKIYTQKGNMGLLTLPSIKYYKGKYECNVKKIVFKK
jgi:hypothetical protein